MAQRRIVNVVVLLALVVGLIAGGLAAPRTAQAASNDNNVEWNGLGHNPGSNFCGDANYAYRYFGTGDAARQTWLRARAYQDDLTAVTLWYTTNGSATTQGQWTAVAMSWETNYNCGGANYGLWKVSLPPLAGTVYYQIQYTDGSSNAWQRWAGEGSGIAGTADWTAGNAGLTYSRGPSYVTRLGQGLGATDSRNPGPTQPVTLYARSDTLSGETMCVEYRVGSGGTDAQAACSYSSAVTREPVTGFHHSAWHCTVPAQAAGSTVYWRLYTVTSGACAAKTGAANYTTSDWPNSGQTYTVTAACTGSAGDIIINEVMYDQVGDGARYANGEWVELYNKGAGGTCVNLDNFRLDDQDTHLYDFPNMSLFAGDYAVVYSGKSPQSSQAGPKDYTANFRFDDGVRPPMPPSANDYAFVLWMNMTDTIWNDTGDEVLLYVENGGGTGYQIGTDTPVDVVSYETANDAIPTGFTWTCSTGATSATQGRSISLKPGQPSGNCAGWEESGSSGISGRTGNGANGKTRGPHSIGGPNNPAAHLGLVCAASGSTPAIDGSLNEAAWDSGSTSGASTRYIPEYTHAFPSPSRSTNTGSDYAGESAARTFWSWGTTPTVTTLSSGDADVKGFWVTSDANNLYLGVSQICAIWPGRYSNNDYVDLFIAIDTDNTTGNAVYRDAAIWNKRVDFAGWNPDYVIGVERIGGAGDYAALIKWNGSAWTDVRAGGTFAYGAYWAGDYNACTLEFKIPYTDLLASPWLRPPAGAVWNFAIYTTHDSDNYDVYDSGPGIGNSLFFEQIGDYPRDADYACGISDPVDIANGGTDSNETLCGDAFGSNIYQDSDNSYVGDDPLDGGNQPGSDNHNGDDKDTIMEYYAVEMDASSCYPLAVDLAAFTAAAGADGVTLAWETVSEADNAGFNLYRAEAPAAAGLLTEPPADAWVRVNDALIPAAAPGAGTGHAYTLTDTAAAPGASYWYLLEDVALDGTATQHEPVAVSVAAQSAEPNAVGLAAFGADGAARDGAVTGPGLAALAALVGLALAGLSLRRR